MSARMQIRIGRVVTVKSRNPSVVANVGEHRTTWNRRAGWKCTCRAVECAHVAALLGVLDPSVFTLDPMPRAAAQPNLEGTL